MTTRRERLVPALVALAFAPAACGGDAATDDGEELTASPTATEEVEQGPSPQQEETSSPPPAPEPTPSPSSSPSRSPGPTQQETSESEPAGGCERDPIAITIVAVDVAFEDPHRSRLCIGDEVVFDNRGSLGHTGTANDGRFDTGTIAGGDSRSVTLTGGPGTLGYRCSIHPDAMSGTLEIVGGAVPPHCRIAPRANPNHIDVVRR